MKIISDFFLFVLGCSFSEISYIISPCIQWNSPWTVAFNPKIINSSHDPEISILTPIGSPGVSNNPILLATFFINSPSLNADIMIISLSPSCVFIDARCVVFKGCRKCNLAWNRTSIKNLVHHGDLSTLFLGNNSMFFYCVDFSRSLSCASAPWTIFAFNFSSTP